MGRTLKRVPIDFEYPKGKVWEGYINPYKSKDCTLCECSGYNELTRKLSDSWYSFENQEYKPNPFREGSRYNANAWSNNLDQEDVQALIDDGRLWDFTRVPINEEQVEIVKNKIKEGGNSWLPFDNGYIPTAKEVNEWNLKTMGHDGFNSHICVKAKAKRLGFYGLCEACDGEGYVFESEEIKKLHEEFEDFEPPIGEGFQLWETTSEGSPNSPVFETFEELCEWCEENATTFADFKTNKESWMKMLDEGFVYHQEGGNLFF